MPSQEDLDFLNGDMSQEDSAFLHGSSGVDGAARKNEEYWRKKLNNQPVLKTPPPRSMWRRFVDSADDTVKHYSPAAAGARAVERALPLDRDYDRLTYGRAAAAEMQRRRRAKVTTDERDYREVRSNYDPADSFADHAVDIGGSIAGGFVSDPTNIVAPGGSVVRQMVGAGITGLVSDAALQGLEMKEGVRDKFDATEALVSAAGGPLLTGGIHGVKVGGNKLKLGRKIASGVNDPEFGGLHDTILALEGGGTLENPKTSPKGAKGPMQVMDATARDPGFGIRPWDGKTEADRARVGRQYAAVLNDKYKGDKAKVLAAYNGGFGRVDRLVKLYGDDWLRHMPDESRNYVRNGLAHMGEAQADAVGRAPASPMAPEVLARVMNDPEAAGRGMAPEEEAILRQADNNVSQLPTQAPADIAIRQADSLDAAKSMDAPDNVSVMQEHKNADFEKQQQNINRDLEQNYWMARTVLDAVKRGDAKAPDLDRLTGLRKDLLDHYEHASNRKFPDEIETKTVKDTLDVIDEAIAHRKPVKDVLTPAERQEMDASAVKPDNGNTGIVGKVGGVVKDILADNDGAFRPFGRKEPRYSERAQEHPDLGLEGAEAKLHDELTKAIPLRNKQSRLYKEELAKRVAAAANVRDKTDGIDGLHKELGSLKGELPKVDFEGVKEKFSTPEVNELLRTIKTHPRLSYFDTVNARLGLIKLLDGQLPTKSELALLSDVFPHIGEALDGKTKIDPTDVAANILGIPRAMMASFDLSAPLRQGATLIHTKEFWGSFGSMFKQAFSEKAFQTSNNMIYADPLYKAAVNHGLFIARQSKNLLEREEQFMSNYAERIPVIGWFVRGSDRAYTGFLNKLRFDTFKNLYKEGLQAGLDFKGDPKQLKDIAKFINTATGRGDLGKTLNSASPLLTAVFFSPRLMASRFQMLNPVYYARLSPFARKQAIKSVLAYSSAAVTVLGLASAAGLSVETDPRSTDFAKIKIGNTRYDVTAGFQPYIRTGAQLLTGQKVKADGTVVNVGTGPDGKALMEGRWETHGQDKGPYTGTRLTTIGSFFGNKEAPIPAFASKILTEKSPDGKPLNYSKEALDLVTPMIINDTIEAVKDRGAAGLMVFPPSLFGIGTNTYATKEGKTKDSKFLGKESDMDKEDETFLNGSDMSKEDAAFLSGK